MDELDLLKKDWKKKENTFAQLNETELYAMLHKKSSSVVKWILIISIIEVLFWAIINIAFVDDDYLNMLKTIHLDTFLKVFSVINYVVIAIFIYVFYKNYKTISTTDTVTILMKSIIKTRKTVQNYVWYNLIMFAVVFIITVFCQFTYDPNLSKLIEKFNHSDNAIVVWFLFAAFYIVTFLILFGLFWLFYKLIYGFLMKKLLNNYNELKKIDL